MADDDNIFRTRTVVAPATATHWQGNTLTAPDASKYLRGTIHWESGNSAAPLVGRIEDINFTINAASEDLPDGACGFEGIDFYEYMLDASVTGRFRAGDTMPMPGQIYVIKAPEGGGMVPIRMVCMPGSDLKATIRGMQKVTFKLKMPFNLVRSTLVSAPLRADGTAISAQTQSTVFSTGDFGDAQPAEV